MPPSRKIWLSTASCILLALGALSFFYVNGRQSETNLLRCGNVGIISAENAYAAKGSNYDLARGIAKIAEKELQWNDDVNPQDFQGDFEAGKYDVVCSFYIVSQRRLKDVGFSNPIALYPVYLYVRAKDTRFDQGLTPTDNRVVKLASVDRSLSDIAADEAFPEAQKISVSTTDTDNIYESLLTSVAKGKADGVLLEASAFEDYNGKHPGMLKQAGDRPAHVFPVAFPISKTNMKTKSTVDNAVGELQKDGFITELFEKYPEEMKGFIPIGQATGGDK
jgi:ABC-type amino acid transport substrate-binding protein